MTDLIEKTTWVKYPLKIGYSDKSGKDENIITDSNDHVVVGGWGDCCRIGGIRHRNIALVIIKSLNKTQPKFLVHYYEEVQS